MSQDKSYLHRTKHCTQRLKNCYCSELFDGYLVKHKKTLRKNFDRVLKVSLCFQFPWTLLLIINKWQGCLQTLNSAAESAATDNGDCRLPRPRHQCRASSQTSGVQSPESVSQYRDEDEPKNGNIYTILLYRAYFQVIIALFLQIRRFTGPWHLSHTINSLLVPPPSAELWQRRYADNMNPVMKIQLTIYTIYQSQAVKCEMLFCEIINWKTGPLYFNLGACWHFWLYEQKYKKTHKCGKINEIKMKANSMKRINKNKYLSLTKKRKNISTFAIWNHWSS